MRTIPRSVEDVRNNRGVKKIKALLSSFFFYLILSIVSITLTSCSSAPRYSSDNAGLTPRSRYYRTRVNPSDFPQSGENYRTGVKYHWVSSFYGRDFHGRLTSNGEVYDMNAMTCAHRELPFNTLLLVQNPVSGKTVTVRVNDRGLFVPGRDLDLSQGAAEKIGMIEKGVKTLVVEIIELPVIE
jgi:rare lipoprotein A